VLSDQMSHLVDEIAGIVGANNLGEILKTAQSGEPANRNIGQTAQERVRHAGVNIIFNASVSRDDA
jgi:hypothetical protein